MLLHSEGVNLELMISLFRRIRKSLLAENRVSRYLIYATGEIVLVVIGILIALSINNWNQSRIDSKHLQRIYRTIQTNLKTDTLNVSSVIEFHERIDKVIDRQLNGELTEEFITSMDSIKYRSCLICQSMITSYDSFVPQQKGKSLLESFANKNESASEALSDKIMTFYAIQIPQIEANLERLDQLVMKNLDEFEEKAWYADLASGRLNHDALYYFKDNPAYKNKAVTFKLISGRNYLRDLSDYKTEATELLKELESEL
ncbi:MAG: hypothetical protein HKN45_06585 [Flavobacteriales bacterium]|nr:hypothetical protein [Flavobacteriales bacterium]